jgi:molybdopterin-containing oxidoreductase family iron-sulfur binding subunit
VFGDLNDKQSQVAQQQNRPRSYALLQELNIRPRTQYLALIRNPNPELG